MANKNNRNQIYDNIIIGGGAAGLMCAAMMKADSSSLLLEKTGKVGTKLLMSGGGRCNITHGGSIKDFVFCYGDAGSKIRRVLYKHSNLILMEFFESNGLPLMEEEDGRVFPKSGNSKDVLSLLLNEARKNRVEIKTNSKVLSISPVERADYNLWEITCTSEDNKNEIHSQAEEKYVARNIVIACGGSSYPTTGSDGTFFEIMKRDLRVDIVEPRPALFPIKVKAYPYEELAGISLAGTIRSGKKSIDGEILFTHEGFSGPAAINLSNHLNPGDSISLNYIGEGDISEVNQKIQTALKGGSSIGTAIAKLYSLPRKLAKNIEDRAEGSTKKVARLLVADEFICEAGDFNKAMTTKGGVSLDGVNLPTMELKSEKMNREGIYVIGEALDVTGYTGGYNLQFAFSSAATAVAAINANYISQNTY